MKDNTIYLVKVWEIGTGDINTTFAQKQQHSSGIIDDMHSFNSLSDSRNCPALLLMRTHFRHGNGLASHDRSGIH